MERWVGKVAVVTGASAGIGLATAKALVLKGMIVVGLARRKDVMLKEMMSVNGPGEFHAVACNVSDEKSVKEAFKYIKDTFAAVHVLVNNAGIVKSSKTIEDADTKELEDVIGVNLMGVLYCYKQAIVLMKSNGQEGHIINMNSIAGHKVPNAAWSRRGSVAINVYPATKFAMTALSETFVNELNGSKIRVTNLSPGYVRTAIAPRNVEQSKIPALNPEDVADSILFILGTPAHVQITELTVKPLGEPF